MVKVIRRTVAAPLPVKTFEVWIEGYSADLPKPEKIGVVSDTTFARAAKKALLQWRSTKTVALYSNFSADPPTMYKCRMFDNEADARKKYG